MATLEHTSSLTELSLTSHQIALCIVPPLELCESIDRLRAQHDKAFGKWSPHINLLYPFVAAESLPRAMEMIQAQLATFVSRTGPAAQSIRLDKAGSFAHRQSCTIFVTYNDTMGGGSYLEQLREAVGAPFKLFEQGYQAHLTVGQSQGLDAVSRDYLLSKTALLPIVDWPVGELTVLVRDHTHHQGNIVERHESIRLYRPKRSNC